MDGYALIAALEYMTELYLIKKAEIENLRKNYEVLANLTPMPVPPILLIPKNIEEAEAMQKLGMAWLASNAPHRLTEEARQHYRDGGTIYVAPMPSIKKANESIERARRQHLSPDADPGGDSNVGE